MAKKGPGWTDDTPPPAARPGHVKSIPAPDDDPRATGAYGDSVARALPKLLVDSVTRGASNLARRAVGAELPYDTGTLPAFDNYVDKPRIEPRLFTDNGKPLPPAPIAPPPAPDQDPYFGPAVPIRPQANPEDVAGREFDYPQSINLNITPRQYETISFLQLRALADNYDLLRILIERRKDQMQTVTGSFLPIQAAGEQTRKPADDRCQRLQEMFLYPDRRLPFSLWQRKLMEEMFVIDAPTLYVRRNYNNEPVSFEIMDGSMIIPRLYTDGRPPEPPRIAYTQILKGTPAIHYRADELVYWPRNPRAGRLYGKSPVEQILTTVLIGLRRETHKLGFYTDGNMPDALMPAPDDWTAEDIRRFQAAFDARMRDPRKRFNKITFVPGGGKPPVFTRSEAVLFGPFDEWLARVCTYALSEPNTAFVQQNNRAVAETANEAALAGGQNSLMIWWKSLLDHIVQKICGYPDLEYVYDDKSDIDPAELIEQQLPAMAEGLVSGDELRGKMGLEPVGLRHMVKGVGPLGFMFVDDMIKASQMGLTLPQTAPPGGDPGMGAPGAPPGAPPMLTGPGGGPPPINGDALTMLQGVPPDLLAAVGLGPEGSAGRSVNVTQQEALDADPLGHAVAHPQVLATLRAAERLHKRAPVKPTRRAVRRITPRQEARP
jgi:hypothetical protein